MPVLEAWSSKFLVPVRDRDGAGDDRRVPHC
jgi:hypothetical protein